ncbi:50S ribosomal protein L19 [Candidatus Microgenomates bacterium]|nr:50S ribosomal protein L19 [Candidatus Microgenomates bacterium]
MALTIKHKQTLSSGEQKDVEFGVGDRIRVYQKIKEGDKTRVAFFEGMVLGIKGIGERKNFLVRRIGEARIGIERIFPISSPTITEVKVIKKGTKGARRAKLYYTREKSPREIEAIYTRNKRREEAQTKKVIKKKKTKIVKKSSKTSIKK